MRSIQEPFVVARPTGARIRARVRLSTKDEAVVRAVGEHLGQLAGGDLAWRCRLARTEGLRSDLRTDRKRALTATSSSRWAGAITRTSNDQWQRGYQNLLDTRVGLHRAVKRIRARLAAPVGQGRGRVQGYASRAERFEKQRRLQRLEARLAEIDGRLAEHRVSICRGGRRLAKLRHALDRDANGATMKLTEAGMLARKAAWRVRWEAERWFVTADGEADKPWGNETIRVHPDQRWCQIRLPTSLAYLSNTPGRAATYRLSCPVGFTHRADHWAAQAAHGAVRYDLIHDLTKGGAKGRWYLDASWQIATTVPPPLQELRLHRTFGLDLNGDHLAGWILDASGNPTGTPHTIPLELEGQAASIRDGRLRAAISEIIRLALAGDCHSITVEHLDFTDARQTGRENLGRGRRGKHLRRIITGIPIRKFRDLLVGMAANAGLWVVAVDPAWTSRWGRRHWQAPLGKETRASSTVTAHHAAAVVIGRRGLGYGARRRPGVTRLHQRMGRGELPARPGEGTLGCEGPDPPGGRRAAALPHKTRWADRSRLGDQVVQDRSGPSISPVQS
jgi:hypothetical protein